MYDIPDPMCKQCEHWWGREMIQKTYVFTGEIPCLTCSRCRTEIKDNFTPKTTTEKNESQPDQQLRVQGQLV